MEKEIHFYKTKPESFDDVFKIDSAIIVVTTACNLKCTYCFEEHESRLIKPEALITVIDRLYANQQRHHGSNQPLVINFFGGEPLLAWKSMRAAYAHIHKKKYHIHTAITTNLTLLTDEMIELFDEEQVGLLVSIDGTKDIHDANRDGSYDVVVANIRRLLDAGLGHLLEARMTVTPPNLGRITECVQHLFDLGFDNVAAVPATDQEWSKEEEFTFEQDIDRLFQTMLAYYEDTENRRNLAVNLVDRNLYASTTLHLGDDRIPCTMGGIRWVAIAPGGEIYPCHQIPTRFDIRDELYLGNILHDVAFSDRLLGEIKPNSWWKTGEYACDTCDARALCRGGCPAENLSETGLIGSPTDTHCKQNQALHRVVTSYHESILAAPNVRNRVINKLKANLVIAKQLEDLLHIDAGDPLFVVRAAEAYGLLAGSESIVLPAFRTQFIGAIKAMKGMIAQRLSVVSQVENSHD